MTNKERAFCKYYGEYNYDNYLVLTDKEADEKCREYILDSVWAFRPSFLVCHAKRGVDMGVFEAIQANNKCEDNNAAILALIDDVDNFVYDAIATDGRGHFLSSYDGKENEITYKNKTYYVYRQN